MESKEKIIDGLSCENCPDAQRCQEQQTKKEYAIYQVLQDIPSEYDNIINRLRQIIPSVTRCDYVLEKQLKRKEQELEPFKDDYFKNLDTKTIAELAKKSIRITTEYCKLENILRDIKEICLQQNLKADFTACEILDIINKAKEK